MGFERFPQHDGEKPEDAMTPGSVGVTALAICLGLIVAMVAFTVNLVDALRPKVGDMIVFDAGGRHNDPARVDAPRWANGRAVGEVCAMDPAIIAANGGSLVIEARDPSGGEMEYQIGRAHV